MQRWILRIVLALAALVVLAFALDYASWRFGVPPRPQYGSVDVKRYYAVKGKDGKLQYMFDNEPVTETCTNSLLPLPGYSPCWWLTGHTRERIDVK